MNRFLYLAAMLSYIAATLLPASDFPDTAVSVLCLLAVLTSLPAVRGPVLFFGLGFLAGGILLLARSGITPAAYVTSFGDMIQMVTLFAFIPILTFPVRFGDYAEQIRHLVRKRLRGTNSLYLLTSAAAYLFSSFMNLAALPLTYDTIARSAGDYPIGKKKRFLTRAITHGYAMPLVWSPLTPIVGTVLDLTGTEYAPVLPYLIGLSAAGLTLDWLTAGLILRRAESGPVRNTRTEVAAARALRDRPYRLIHIPVALIILNGLIILLDQWLKQSFLFLVTLLVLPFSGIWCLLIRRGALFFPAVRHHFNTWLPKMVHPFFIFLSAGFFITTLHVSGADATLTEWVAIVIRRTDLRVFLVVLPLIPFALAFLGLHPAVSLALIAGSVHSGSFFHTPVVITVAMLGSAVPAFLMGPYNATLSMMSGIVDEKPFTLSKWNFSFTWRYLVMLTVMIQLLYTLL
ncbi:hypothetical protein [Sporolactobacillus sp. THM19-2]|uniref:hypothetical protein n=1 Tax=Sporolactobacillus sp. THM19-2 TaxID=2511171 RepID=UPI0010204EEF|nr:hypothetical protein [Sporolactobacillus sp. THM19-2]RYL92458.1 hypothetical protein EWH91_07970 [Sporolactobacillus sp. THM19-2]